MKETIRWDYDLRRDEWVAGVDWFSSDRHVGVRLPVREHGAIARTSLLMSAIAKGRDALRKHGRA